MLLPVVVQAGRQAVEEKESGSVLHYFSHRSTFSLFLWLAGARLDDGDSPTQEGCLFFPFFLALAYVRNMREAGEGKDEAMA